MHYPVLPASAFIAAFLILIPAFWHWPARHIPTLSLIVWLFATNIIYGVDSLAWSGDVRNKAPVWCDISTKFIIGASVGLPACTLCLCKHLAMIGGGRTAGLDSGDLRRIAMFDFGICWGTPVVFMALHYVVQGHRYNIIQYIGCRATTYISIPGLLIIHVPPLLLSVGTSVYAGIALYHFVRVHRTLSNVLQASNSRLSPNLYVRLMAMSVTLMLWGTMLTSVMIWVNTLHGIQPWVSWKNVHLNWNRANVLIWAKADPRERRLQLLMWWWIPSSTAISFIFLGFGEDALREYRRIGSAVMSAISSRVLPNGNKKSGEEVPPVLSFPPSGLRLDGLSTALPTNTSTTNQTPQELPQIRPLRSLYSMIGPPRSKSQSRSSGKSHEWRWSAKSEKSGPAPLQSDETESRLCDYASGAAAVVESREDLISGSIQEATKGQEPHDQV